MPGQMETYLNICGEKDLIDYVKKCWASAYNVEAIMYRMNKGMPFLFNIGVGIPKMVNSRVSGIIFTINPVNGDPSKISIDASFGLGEAVVSGIVTPDTYLIDKITMDPIKTVIGSKEIQCVYREDGSDIVQVPVPEEKRCVPCLERRRCWNSPGSENLSRIITERHMTSNSASMRICPFRRISSSSR